MPVCVVADDRRGATKHACHQKNSIPLHQSETAFVRPLSTNAYHLRWFTPTTEVPLCGHATLAAAAALVAAGHAALPATLTFQTVHSGDLAVAVTAGADGEPHYELDMPARPPTDAPPPCVAGVSAPLVEALTAGTSVRAASTAYNAALQYAVVVLDAGGDDARAAVESLAPSAQELVAAAPAGVSGLIATARTTDNTIVSRFWGPWLGIDEDPVTGSAHAVLGPLWLGEAGACAAEQLSARGGDLSVAVEKGRVKVGGRGKVVVRGELCL